MENEGTTPAEPTVLVVERDILVRMPIAAYLRECGYKVIEAVDSDEALTLLQAELRIDVVFTDAQLHGATDGFGLAQWVRQNRPEAQVIIAATPNRAAAEAGKLCEEGPLLAKPYDHQIVESRIRQLLAARQRQP